MYSFVVGMILRYRIAIRFRAKTPKMNTEKRLLDLYRASDARGRASILEHAESTAEDWPADDLSLPNNEKLAPSSLPSSEL